MHSEEVQPGSPQDWLRHARSDLELARTEGHDQILLEDLCFHAQQAAEKALKAVLVAHSVVFPRTHNLRTLIDLLPAEVAVSVQVQEAITLTDYAVSARYPGDLEPIDQHEYSEAVQLAQAVVAWAEANISLRRSVTQDSSPGEDQPLQEADQ